MPRASVSLGRLSVAPIWLYYALLAILTRKEPSRLRALWQRLTNHLPTKMAIVGLAVAVLLVWMALGSLPDGRLHVAFLDVGQGDAIFIQTPRGRQILIDGGPNPATLTAALGRRMPFWDRTIDLVILTHPDDDHLTGLIPVLERYRVGQILESGYEHSTSTYQRWLELIEEKKTPAHLARSGMRLGLEEGLELAILHPGPELLKGTEADSNNNSVVSRLSMGRVSFLFPGDIEEVVETMLLASGRELSSTVLKVPHHGSDTSSSAPFLEAVNPQLAVISVGADNRFGCPSPEVVERLEGRAILKRTDEDGTIEVVTDG
ncbi:MAG TPA: MBL fold metallo-hydrolase, partial [Anaerolineae bacterium]|nr:MBL fold metallo-hydrolase [Anaerolineae bacterium]